MLSQIKALKQTCICDHYYETSLDLCLIQHDSATGTEPQSSPQMGFTQSGSRNHLEKKHLPKPGMRRRHLPPVATATVLRSSPSSSSPVESTSSPECRANSLAWSVQTLTLGLLVPNLRRCLGWGARIQILSEEVLGGVGSVPCYLQCTTPLDDVCYIPTTSLKSACFGPPKQETSLHAESPSGPQTGHVRLSYQRVKRQQDDRREPIVEVDGTTHLGEQLP